MPAKDPISLVSATIQGPVVAYKSVVFPINLDNIGQLAFKWQIFKLRNCKPKPS